MFALFVVLSIAVGTLSPIQACMSNSLNRRVGIWEGTFISMVVCVIICSILMPIQKCSWAALGNANPGLLLIAGVLGVVIIVTLFLPALHLGNAVSQSISIISGLLSGMVVDQFGLFGMEPIHVNSYRIIGAIIMVFAILFNYMKKPAAKTSETSLAEKADGKNSSKLPWVILAIVNGLIVTCISPVNRMLGMSVGGATPASLLSRASSAVILIVIILITRKGDLRQTFKGNTKWDLLGGVSGTVNIVFNTMAMSVIGSVINSVALTVGRLGFSMIIDSFGWLLSPKIKVSPQRIIAFVLMLVGLFVMNMNLFLG